MILLFSFSREWDLTGLEIEKQRQAWKTIVRNIIRRAVAFVCGNFSRWSRFLEVPRLASPRETFSSPHPYPVRFRPPLVVSLLFATGNRLDETSRSISLPGIARQLVTAKINCARGLLLFSCLNLDLGCRLSRKLSWTLLLWFLLQWHCSSDRS